ncbi:hemicentin-2-like [Haliotis rubra]|uniref:hemicentin-2-like n=1 Tax=Haliotis rubra TaxID=36100 RepID=UPI001EE529DD|nr:hemicentin-2-like [Haliotis rubra]
MASLWVIATSVFAVVLLKGVGAAVTVSGSGGTGIHNQQTLTLRCSYTVTPGDVVTEYTWRRVERSSTVNIVSGSVTAQTARFFDSWENKGVFVGDYTSSLDIQLPASHVTSSYAGTYRCEVTSLSGSDYADVTVSVLSVEGAVTVSGSGGTGIPNQQALALGCSYTVTSGDVVTEFTWRRVEGSSTVNIASGSVTAQTAGFFDSWKDKGVFVGDYTSSLDIQLPASHVTSSYAGTYRCEVTSLSGSGYADVTASVLNPPSISGLPSTQTVTEFSNLRIDCSTYTTPGNPPTTSYTWTYGGSTVSTGAVLDRRNISRSQGGDYTCTASNTRGSDSDSVNVDVQYPPSISGLPSTQTVTEFSNLRIDCSTYTTPGNPPTTSYTWTYGGSTVLDRRNISRSQGGDYICTASNKQGSDSDSVNVDVQYPPSISGLAPAQTVTEFSNLRIDCSTYTTPGNPSTTSYTWTYGGSTVSTGSVLDRRNISRSQGGDYICTASNSQGSDSDSVSVDVQYPPSISGLPPTETVMEFFNFVIDCSTYTTPGNPPTTSYTWTYGGSTVSTGAVLDRRNISRSQGGDYTCTSSNSQGSDSASVNVDVRYGPYLISLTPSTSSYTLTEHQALPSITCSALCRPGCNYRWIHNGTYFSSGAVLQGQADRSKTGSHRCQPYNTHGSSDSVTVSVDVQYPPSISGLPSTQTVTEFSNLRIDCSTYTTAGNPPTTSYTWTYGGSTVSTGAVLDRRNISRSQGGDYICTASNSQGSDSDAVNVDVQYGPYQISLTPSTSSYTVTEHQALPSITCSALCRPGCSYRWLHNGTTFSSGAVLQGQADRSKTGSYRCQPYNTHGSSDSVTVSVNVQYPASISIFTANSLSGSVTVNESDPATLSCQVYSNPRPVIRLLNGTEELTKENNSLTSTYRLESVDCRQRGNYSCTATNNIGAPVTKRVELLVKCPPRLDDPVSQQLKYATTLGGDVTVSVSVLGYPLPTFIWSRSISTSQDLTGSSSPVSDISVTARLHLTNLQQQDFGDYSLTVDSGVGGIVTYTLDILSEGPPSTPTNISVSPEGPFSLHVSWKEEFNGGATQTFTVEYSTDEKDWKTAGSHTETGSGNYLTSVINDLNSDTLYYVRVVARNKFGSSSYTEHVTGLTEKEVIPPAPSLPAGLIAGVTVGVVLVVGIVVVVVVMTRKGYRCILQKPGSTDTQNASRIPENRGDQVHFQDVNPYSGLQDRADDKQTYTELKNYENTGFRPSTDTVNTYEDINQTSRHAYEHDKPALYVNADIKGKDSPYVNT